MRMTLSNLRNPERLSISPMAVSGPRPRLENTVLGGSPVLFCERKVHVGSKTFGGAPLHCILGRRYGD